MRACESCTECAARVCVWIVRDPHSTAGPVAAPAAPPYPAAAMKQRVGSGGLLAVLIAGLAACGGSGSKSGDSDDSSSMDAAVKHPTKPARDAATDHHYPA